MPQFLISEPAEAILSVLGDALDLVDVGILLLNRDMRARFINRRLEEMFHLPPTLMASGPAFRELLDHGAANVGFALPAYEQADYLNQRDAAVRAGSVPPTRIDLADGRRLSFCCTACPDGGRILTYADISQELRREAREAAEQINAELRFSSETMEEQAAYLASLAEGADESARVAEAAKRALEREIIERCRLEDELRRLATTDGLTGALNRAACMASGQRAVEYAREAGQNLAVLMLDVDHFKAINDGYGHAGGDLALRHLVATLRAGIRDCDVVGRLGGEEFAVVLPTATIEVAETVAERLRSRVAETPLEHGDRVIEMTVSVGLAIQRETDRGIEQLIARADAALYQAKRSGRNRVVKEECVAQLSS